jgi:hypothetical protein
MLVNEQYNFVNNSSAEKASDNLHNEILPALNDKLLVGSIFCNLRQLCHFII